MAENPVLGNIPNLNLAQRRSQTIYIKSIQYSFCQIDKLHNEVCQETNGFAESVKKTESVTMSTATSKRPLDVSTNANNTASLVEDTTDNKKSSLSKKSKPLDKEARLKRTQQNRAAQRAFRERKEKKMKELESKVNKLTEIQKQNEIESSFLRDQLNILLLELKKYRPATNNDSKVLNYLSQHNHHQSTDDNYSKGKYDFNFNANSQTTPNISTNNELTPPMEDKEMSEPSQKKQEQEQNSEDGMEDRISSNWLDNILSDNDLFNQQLFTNSSSSSNSQSFNSQISYSNKYNDNKIISSDSPHGVNTVESSTSTDFDNQFDEQVANFCVKMNQACGTKSNPVPRNKSVPPSTYSESINTTTTNTNNVLNTENSPHSSSSLSFASTPSIYSNINNNNNNNNNNNSTRDSSLTNNNLSLFTPPSHTNTPPSSFSNFGKTNTTANPFDNNSLNSPQLTTCSTDTSTSNGNNSRNNSTTENNNNTGKGNYDLQFLSNDFEIPFINSDLAFPTSNDNDIFFRDTNPLTGNGSNNILDDFIDEEEQEEKNNEYNKKKSPTTLFNEVPYTVQMASDNTNHEDGDPEIVPSKDGKMLKCSEIWDRITTHPKYSDLDIDGLCGELMAKAKCSERGVVVDADDVQDALTKHMQ